MLPATTDELFSDLQMNVQDLLIDLLEIGLLLRAPGAEPFALPTRRAAVCRTSDFLRQHADEVLHLDSLLLSRAPK